MILKLKKPCRCNALLHNIELKKRKEVEIREGEDYELQIA